MKFELGFWMISTFCLLGTGARADVVNISELTDGVPTVQVLTDAGVDITAQRVTIVADTGAEFLHFKLVTGNAGSGDLAFSDMFENALAGILSDRIVVFYDPAAATVGDDVKFCSDPVLSLCNGNFTFHFQDVVETGQFQHVADIFNTTVGSGMYTINARSEFGDTADVPEPAVGLLGGSIVALMVLLSRRRNNCRTE